MQVRLVDGEAVRQRRRSLRMSVAKLASTMATTCGHQVSRDLLYKIERGERQPSEQTLIALAKALQCRPVALRTPEPTVADVARRLDGLVAVLRRHGIDADVFEVAA